MITLRRARDRHHERRRDREVWRTFRPPSEVADRCEAPRALEALDEHQLSPGARIRHDGRAAAEVVTYVHAGAVTFEDSMGRSGIIRTGEFQRVTGAGGVRQVETNASPSDAAHVYQVEFRLSDAVVEPSHEQRRFSVAERRGALRSIASPDARQGSLRIHLDASVYSAVLEPGQHIVHELSPQRGVWLHVVDGEVTVGELVLTRGDGIGVSDSLALSLTAREEGTEVLLMDTYGPWPTPFEGRLDAVEGTYS